MRCASLICKADAIFGRYLLFGRWRPILCAGDVATSAPILTEGLIGLRFYMRDLLPFRFLLICDMQIGISDRRWVVFRMFYYPCEAQSFRYDGDIYVATTSIIVSRRGLFIYAGHARLVGRRRPILCAFDVEKSVAVDINLTHPSRCILRRKMGS